MGGAAVTDEPSQPRLGVVGLGRMGRIYAGMLAEEAEPGILAGVATLDVEEQSQWLTDHEVEHRFREADALIDRLDLDGLVVATPTHTHADLVVLAAEAGLPVFCEKPLALTVSETRRAIGAARTADIPLQVGFMRRFDAAYRSMREAISEGRIGRPVTFKSIGRDPGCPDPAFARPERSGGLLVDMAIHDFDLAAWLMESPVRRVHAEGTLLVCEELREVGDVDNAVVNMRLENGTLGQVEVSRNALYGYDVRTEVLGSEDAVSVGGDRPEGSSAGDEYLKDRFGPAYRREMRHFLDCVQSRSRPAVSGEEALAAFEVAEAARLSLEEARPVEIAEVREGAVPES